MSDGDWIPQDEAQELRARAIKAEAEVEIWRVAHRATDAARLKAEEEAHYANGVADLAMKHRNEAEEVLREVELEAGGMRGGERIVSIIRAALGGAK